MIKTLYRIVAVIVGIGVFVAGFMAYFMKTVDTNKGIVYDGFGRQLTEPPTWAKIIITSLLSS